MARFLTCQKCGKEYKLSFWGWRRERICKECFSQTSSSILDEAGNRLFEVDEIEWSYRNPKGDIVDRDFPERVREVKSATVRCNTCGHEWRAEAGLESGQLPSGRLLSGTVLGSAWTDCPNCGTPGLVGLDPFDDLGEFLAR